MAPSSKTARPLQYGLCGGSEIFGLSSRSTRNSSHFALWASSESRPFASHAVRYSSRFDCTVRPRVLRSLTAFRRTGVDYGLVFLPGLGAPTGFATVETMVLLRLRIRRRICISCAWNGHTDSLVAAVTAFQLASLVFHRDCLRGSDATGVWQQNSILIYEAVFAHGPFCFIGQGQVD